MKLLVTGASGFVGSALVRRFLFRGHEVHVVLRQSASRHRLEGCLSRLVIHEADLIDEAAVSRVVCAARPEAVFHLATYGGRRSESDVTRILVSNVLGCAALLSASLRAGVALFVNTGSSSEYGRMHRPAREEDCLRPLSEYGVAKASATLLCQAAALRDGAPVVTARLFSPYGPWDDPSRFVPYVIGAYLQGKRPLLGDPTCVRDYVFIEDVLDCYELILKKGESLRGEIVNIGSGRQVSLAEVAACIAAEIGSDLEPQWGVHIPSPLESPCWQADLSRVRDLLGWTPQHTLSQGIAKTVAWMRQRLPEERSVLGSLPDERRFSE
jgi:nucleoside-diphosphate-sugar epimerase